MFNFFHKMNRIPKPSFPTILFHTCERSPQKICKGNLLLHIYYYYLLFIFITFITIPIQDSTDFSNDNFDSDGPKENGSSNEEKENEEILRKPKSTRSNPPIATT